VPGQSQLGHREQEAGPRRGEERRDDGERRPP
jgi:hypothetical protein